MSDIAARIAVAAALLWLGMVLAISFMEAPLKFRVPVLDLRVGLSVGRIVFRALNTVEVGWAVVLAAVLTVHPLSASVTFTASITIALLAVQLAGVRPRLNRRSNLVLAGVDVPRSSIHHVYIVLEVCKVVALIVLSAFLLAD